MKSTHVWAVFEKKKKKIGAFTITPVDCPQEVWIFIVLNSLPLRLRHLTFNLFMLIPQFQYPKTEGSYSLQNIVVEYCI